MIKRIIYTLLVLFPALVTAQNYYNFTGFNDKGLIGTARFVGMGGSMSALGGDISVMGVNPAGIALYRGNDCAITVSGDDKNSKATYGHAEKKCNYDGGRLDNFGMVLANKLNMSDIEFINIGVAYRVNNHFDRNFDMWGAAGDFSQQYVIEELYRRNRFDTSNVTYNKFEDFNYSWLTLLASDGGLVADDGYLILNSDGSLVYPPTHLGYYCEERGEVGVFDINVSSNIKDRIYLGATFSISSVDFSRYSCYYEEDEIGEIYSIENNLKISGIGYDLKLGAILRPFEYTPFKVGVAFHTPTWYRLLNSSNAAIVGIDGRKYDTRDKERYYDNVNVEYGYKTPWRVNASMAYTFGTYLAVNAEYEFTDFRTAAYTGRTTLAKKQNSDIDACLRQQHTARIGAELNLKNSAFRAGYSYSTAMYDKKAYKNIYNMNVTDTSTEYLNLYDKSNVTLGCGYRFNRLYFDIAYMLQLQEGDFYPFNDTEYPNPAASVAYTDHTIALTMGLRF